MNGIRAGQQIQQILQIAESTGSMQQAEPINNQFSSEVIGPTSFPEEKEIEEIKTTIFQLEEQYLTVTDNEACLNSIKMQYQKIYDIALNYKRQNCDKEVEQIKTQISTLIVTFLLEAMPEAHNRAKDFPFSF